LPLGNACLVYLSFLSNLPKLGIETLTFEDFVDNFNSCPIWS
jgi:hypothetical protein